MAGQKILVQPLDLPQAVAAAGEILFQFPQIQFHPHFQPGDPADLGGGLHGPGIGRCHQKLGSLQQRTGRSPPGLLHTPGGERDQVVPVAHKSPVFQHTSVRFSMTDQDKFHKHLPAPAGPCTRLALE